MKSKIFVLLFAGLTPLGWSAGMENARSAPLPQIDAGSILNQIQNDQNHFPQPGHSTLDICVFTEFKDNKCIFKCESGAILTEPALKADLGPGEPACASHILRPINKSLPADSRYIGSSQLEDLLRDQNPEIRKAAVKSAKNYILNSYAQNPVLDILKNTNERADIRVEAARTLSYASGNTTVQNALTDVIKYGNEPRELRVMAYKALWSAAGQTSTMQDFLIDAVKYEKDRDARKAAIWALFGASMNTRTQEALIDVIKYGNEEELTRIEAIKSLFGAMGYPSVKGLMMDLVKYGNERKPVKLAALKALSAGTGDSGVQSFLEDMMKYEQDPELRAAAIEAASPDAASMNEYFHLSYKIGNGGFFNPIEL